jgi:antibiotic biosynthesis monooxygenase (ABM) superfamily enzyme
MARVVIGGLTTSTLITLVFIPVVYFTLETWRESRGRVRAADDFELDAAETAGD